MGSAAVSASIASGERICAFCGSSRNVELGHLDGPEENGEPENLIWTCRARNTRLGVVFKRLGLGRRIRQYNPGQGAASLGQWLTAVLSAKGESGAMTVPAALLEMIHATPPDEGSRFAKEIWHKRYQHGTDRNRPGIDATPTPDH